MSSCKEVSRLISESLERKLPIQKRITIRIHLLYCEFCSAYKKQMLLLREATNRLGNNEAIPGSASPLSPGARERIKDSLKPKDP